MSKNQFTGAATQLQRNRKLHVCQFNKDQYCNKVVIQSILQTHTLGRLWIPHWNGQLRIRLNRFRISKLHQDYVSFLIIPVHVRLHFLL